MIPMGGYRIQINDQLPGELVGHNIEPLYARNWFTYLMGFFFGRHRAEWVCWLRTPMLEHKACMFGNTLFVTSAMYEAMKERIPVNEPRNTPLRNMPICF